MDREHPAATSLDGQRKVSLAVFALAAALDGLRRAGVKDGQHDLIQAALALTVIAEDHQAAQDYSPEQVALAIVNYLLQAPQPPPP